jgi:hypothetical protein
MSSSPTILASGREDPRRHYAAPGNALVADAVIKSLQEDQPVKLQAAWDRQLRCLT